MKENMFNGTYSTQSKNVPEINFESIMEIIKDLKLPELRVFFLSGRIAHEIMKKHINDLPKGLWVARPIYTKCGFKIGSNYFTISSFDDDCVILEITKKDVKDMLITVHEGMEYKGLFNYGNLHTTR